MKQVKSILFKVNAKGRGIVNFDAGHQKRMSSHLFFRGSDFSTGVVPDNISFSKKVFYLDEEGRTKYKILVSSQCVTHETFGAEMPYVAQDIVAVDDLKYDFISSRAAILRGYMLTNSNKTEDTKGSVIKRKSPITLTDFIQTNEAKSFIPIGSATGVRDSNSVYYKESVGDIEYSSIGNSINLRELQFMSLDLRHDRESFDYDDFELFKEKFRETYPTFDAEVKYYLTNGSKINIPEMGFILSADIVKDLVKHYLRNLLFTRVTRNKSFFEVSDIQIKLVSDPFVDTYSDENGWIDLDLETINNLDFEMEEFYTEFDSEEAKMVLGTLAELVKDKKKKKNDLKVATEEKQTKARKARDEAKEATKKG